MNPRNDLNREQQKGVYICVCEGGGKKGVRGRKLWISIPLRFSKSKSKSKSTAGMLYVLLKHETKVGLEEFLDFNLVVVNYLPISFKGRDHGYLGELDQCTELCLKNRNAVYAKFPTKTITLECTIYFAKGH